MLPVPRDVVTIETFVDDTYQNLIVSSGASHYYSGNNQCLLSEDGRTLLFTVAANRLMAEEAERVFVRGAVQVRIARGKPTVVTGKLPLKVGHEVMVGDFRTTVRSVSSSGPGTGANVTLATEGDAVRIQKMRVLEDGGRMLNDQRTTRFQTLESSEGPSTVSLSLITLPTEPVTIEYTCAEKVEPAQIPFEAQVDIGVTKAGPIEAGAAKTPGRVGERQWPPPLRSLAELPPRRATFDPGAGPAAATAVPEVAKAGNALVDLFSITVAKPAPSEVKGVQWKQPPAETFHASGFTMCG